MDESYIVYVCTDDVGHITAINSSAFLTDTAGWTAIDEGCGDRFHHAQGNYLSLIHIFFRGRLMWKTGCFYMGVQR